MATVIALQQLNIGYLNLNNIKSSVFDVRFFDDDPYSYGLPVSFQDQIELHYDTDAFLAFAGTGFVTNGYTVTAGRVQGIIDAGIWKVYGLNLKATDVYAAYLTATATDDLALVQAGLAGNDTITLSSSADKFKGFGGNDTLSGNGGSDSLFGDGGNDMIVGGAGKDVLNGGAGTDRFVFNAISDSGSLANTADILSDFVAGLDKIDLSGIDAFTSTGVNDAFIWQTGAAFNNGSKGEVRVQQFDNTGPNNDYTLVLIDTDNDAGVEMALRLTGLVNLSASDFIL